MYFISDTAPKTWRTDASDYDVGGYLFQTVDGIDQPVAFVIHKEAYGIFYSCMYMQSLVRDRLFAIRTDHQNLLFIKEAAKHCNIQLTCYKYYGNSVRQGWDVSIEL